MKKCPFCKAEIEDNARFCLYCMKTLNEKEVILTPQKKKKWWPLAVVGVLLILLLLLVVLVPGGQDMPSEESSSSTQPTGSETTESTDESTLPSQSEESTPPESTGTQETQQNTTQPSETTPVPTAEPEETTQATSTPTEPEETTQPTSQPTEPDDTHTEVVYSYRVAQAGDDFNANYTNSGNDIVITGIVQQYADGTYDIPDAIDGKRVIAIVANAFSGSNAKIVYVPATVKTIWNYAFAECGLTDIYFRGNAIYVESKAFSGALTIHCSANCSDRNFRYYKNCAASYGAIWEEWNG